MDGYPDPDIVFAHSPSEDYSESYVCSDGRCDQPSTCGGNHTYSGDHHFIYPLSPDEKDDASSKSPIKVVESEVVVVQVVEGEVVVVDEEVHVQVLNSGSATLVDDEHDSKSESLGI